MPISIQLSAGLLTPAGEREVFPRVARTLLEVHGLEGNAFMSANVVGHVVVTPEATGYVGGRPQSLAVIEVKVPSATFVDAGVKRAFVEKVTDIIDELRAGDHPRDRTYVNVTYAVEGTWGIGGKAYTNEELGRAIAAGGP